MWIHFQETEPIFAVFHTLTHKTLTLPGNRKADALVQVYALAAGPSVDAAD